uniref:receptor protein serine/threonine kinase n=1 Tax=Amphilophus citrinellus TaxID=61819 RepID=A0A3Q0SDE7_AMPCI
QQKRRCFFEVNERTKKYVLTAGGNVSGSVQLCENSHCCVGYYVIINGTPKVSALACDRYEKSCPDPICKAQPRSNNKHFVCVCNTDFCNGNINWGTEQNSYNNSFSGMIIIRLYDIVFMKTAIKLVVILIFMCFLIIAAAKCRKEKLQSCSHDFGVLPSCSSQMTKASEINISQIELQQIVGRGHFATVFQAAYKGSVVAVKFLPAAYEQFFTTEKEIYKLPLLKHAGIVNFLGTGKADDRSCFIVLEFAEYGSLHSFLSKHTMSWMSSLKLCQSLSQGLSYLHSDLLSHGVHKPPVAHRDLNSFNVLVRADGTCALCDFGCSAILRCYSGGYRWHNQSTNIKVIKLGTLNYMAPEILEDFVNLNSMFLMQADVYALGLLLWEIWMRCSDLFEDNATPQHLMPYELELGTNATLENLIQYVSYMDQRPSIPEHWQLLPQGADLTEIITDCWDSESDARLTAHRVVERLISLQSSSSL